MEGLASNADSAAVTLEVPVTVLSAPLPQQEASGNGGNGGGSVHTSPASKRADSALLPVTSNANKPAVSATDPVIRDPNLASSNLSGQQGKFNTSLVQGGQPLLPGGPPHRAVASLGSDFVNQPNFHQAQNFAMHPFQQAFAQQN